MNFSELLKKHQHSFIYVDERKKALDILEQLVDVEEKPLGFLPGKRIESLAVNAVNSIYFDKPESARKESIKLFFVLNNKKSRKYYQHPYYIKSENDPLLKDDRLYIFLDETAGIIETNCSLLDFDVKILSGITHENVEKEDIYFKDYISAFEHREEINEKGRKSYQL